MRMRRAQHQRVHRRLWRMVVGIAALAANERVVFLAEHALTDAEFDGSCHRISNSRFYSGGHIAAVTGPAQTAFARMATAPAQHNRSVQRISSRLHTKKPRARPGL